ncbi:hypothetical protein CYMTET_53878 [Cymbomonas tetramitiformis]|uniref:Inward rectifier potassium channel C-terminal domain-containing protein n=1 Tax=Cymbomonas tetramitiformis TaxID=36881 RepID=A0AAE0BHG3_9CHLO|nr:hypothetical protein CYMTET_53878 [Cymbomonas tetramitiformis]|eukprot:gene24829-30251_t
MAVETVTQERDFVRHSEAAKTSQRSEHLKALRSRIKEHISDSHVEIVVLVEAVDPHSSCTFQARHSYTDSDVVFDHMFKECMSLGADGNAELDLSEFHLLIPAPFEVDDNKSTAASCT